MHPAARAAGVAPQHILKATALTSRALQITHPNFPRPLHGYLWNPARSSAATATCSCTVAWAQECIPSACSPAILPCIYHLATPARASSQPQDTSPSPAALPLAEYLPAPLRPRTPMSAPTSWPSPCLRPHNPFRFFSSSHTRNPPGRHGGSSSSSNCSIQGGPPTPHTSAAAQSTLAGAPGARRGSPPSSPDRLWPADERPPLSNDGPLMAHGSEPGPGPGPGPGSGSGCAEEEALSVAGVPPSASPTNQDTASASREGLEELPGAAGGRPAAAVPPGAGPSLLVVKRASLQGTLDRAGSALLTNAVDLAAKLNQVTGYDVIEQLKAKVNEADEGLEAARERLRAARALYEARMAEHGDVQRQLMALLQRKSSWGAADVEQFAELCRREHGLEHGVTKAKGAYGSAAEDLEEAHGNLLRAIRERYSAETLWSDKIRRASTWWTSGLMALNLASFLSVYLIMEPIKARRLRNHVEEVLREELTAVRQSVSALQATLDSLPQAPRADLAAGASLPLAVGGILAPGGSNGGGVGDPVAAAAALLPEVRHVRGYLAALEQRVAEVSSGLAGQVEAFTKLAAAVSVEGGPRGALGGGAVDGQELKTGGAPDSATGLAWEGTAGGEKEGAQGGWRRRLAWLGKQLHRAAAMPEVTAGAAAFAGAVVGAGMLVVLRDWR